VEIADRLLKNSLIRCGKSCSPGRGLLYCHPIFRSKTCFASDANEAVTISLNRDTRGHLCGSDSSASRPCDALGVPVALAQHPDEHRPERPVLLAVNQQFGEGAGLRLVVIT
jgi:hypothetical protein